MRDGYDAIADAYLAARTREGDDVDRLMDLVARLPAGALVLDAGCGAGLPVTDRLVGAGLTSVGLDLSIRQLELGNELVPESSPVQADLATLPFADASFDAVVSFYAVIHVPRADHPSVFAEVRRVLRPGGLALLCLGARDNPYDDEEESWLGAPMFWSHFDAPTNVRLVRDAGLDVVDDRILADPMSHGSQLFVLARRP